MGKVKRDDKLCIAVTIIGIVLFVVALHNARDTYPLLKYKSNLICKVPKCYNTRHWKNRISKSCMHCLHNSFITKHWSEDGLFCENCKKFHKGKIAKHYYYDKALRCRLCGHEKMISKGHNEAKIACAKCKMGHYDYYNKNVLNRGKK